ncbi:LamG-like jellyroll fold domain-containing protein [Christiangramia sediminicola]|uniref:LamG-like jellyroll fold domain-containing protein n=1 Tax=Christiangramia sediminicola TaxID=3073267 RepID=A0ABU1EMF6_9FLAO|nr:LamG-like jellyroll fold domain-containing protein [Christiangramia sp. SM2212]MDR5589536.1 LamG-like jellyroll fold domain-containing protein [Christiangramia sp. SM2212]
MMKFSNIKFFGFIFSLLLFTSCEYDGIDSITPVDPGADEGAPEITITAPAEGNTIKVLEEVSSINIKFKVVDDIEVANIDVMVDGNMIASMNEFLDYRIVNEEVVFDNVTNGEHTVTVTATDLDGNTASKTVNFSKEPPYTPKFQNEYLYMPFDGDYVDLITLKTSDVTGNPGFAGESFLGSNSYMGAADSYLDFPFDGSIGTEFTATFWYNVSGDPDRAGILVAGADENRTQGFRLFREGSATEQRIKLNVGTGEGEVWNDGGTVDPSSDEWVHVAFTVTAEQTAIYIDGMLVNTGNMAGMAIDWTGVENLTIGAGGETFSYWGHEHDTSSLDELRFFDKALSQEEIQGLINASSETLKLSFDGSYQDDASNKEVTVVGSPSISSDTFEGSGAYAGAADSYLTLPSEGLLSKTLSATFWYKVNATPDRAGIIVVGPEDSENPDAQNVRTSGFRLFREGNATEQRIKLNVGTGEAESWNDGGVIDVTAGEWVHVAFTISETETAIYLDGELVNTGSLGAPVDWTGTDIVSIMSGAPRFTGWGHLADASMMDELTFYNKVLTPEEIQAMATE